MKSQVVKKQISKLPDSPGVYIFKSKKQKIKGRSDVLYIGKATSLRDRVKSYMSSRVLDTRGPLVAKMVKRFDTIDYIKTDSVLEALILEAHLIKKYQPEANVAQKDNRSFNFVVITREDFPRVLVARGRELLHHRVGSTRQDLVDIIPKSDLGGGLGGGKIGHIFGPFPNGGQLKEAMKLIRKIFPYRDKCTPSVEDRLPQMAKNMVRIAKPCFNRQIGLCPGVCTGEITKEEYARQIRNITMFFEGNKKSLIKSLEKQMKSFSHSKEFEKANKIKKTIFALNHIQDVSLIKDEYRVPSGLDSKDAFRIESYDIAHMSGENVVGVMTVVEDGEKAISEYRKFRIKNNPGVNDTKALKEVLERRLGHIEWKTPNLIVVDGGGAQKRAMEDVLKRNKQNIPVVSVVKDERHKPKEILGDKKWLAREAEIILSNAEAHRFAISYHKKLRRKFL